MLSTTIDQDVHPELTLVYEIVSNNHTDINTEDIVDALPDKDVILPAFIGRESVQDHLGHVWLDVQDQLPEGLVCTTITLFDKLYRCEIALEVDIEEEQEEEQTTYRECGL